MILTSALICIEYNKSKEYISMELHQYSTCLRIKMFYLKILRFAYPDIPDDQIIFLYCEVAEGLRRV